MSPTTRTLMMLLAMIALMTPACLFTPEDEGGGWGVEEPPPGPEPEPEPEPALRPELRGMFVSGHLGTYDYCPGEGYTGRPSGADMSSVEGAPAEGDCDGDNCGGFIGGCEDALVVITLANDGQAVARNLDVTKIRLLDEELRELGVLPLNEIRHADGEWALFEDDIAPGGQASVRVTFLGPERLWELKERALADEGVSEDPSGDEALPNPDGSGRVSPYGSGAIIELTVTADDAEPLIMRSKVLYTIPAVDT